jgi:hypothetical protein
MTSQTHNIPDRERGSFTYSDACAFGIPVVVFTFYGSDADTERKNWRSIGCQSVRPEEFAANLAAAEQHRINRTARREYLGYVRGASVWMPAA